MPSKQGNRSHYVVYILQCADKTLYTGITNNLERRFAQHKAGTASHYTRSRKARKIVHVEKCKNKSAALKREAAIKRLSKQAKLAIIKNGSN